MANSEVLYFGGALKQGLAGIFSQRGPHLGHAVARQYVYEVSNVVAEVMGKDAAATMMFNATDAMLSGIPMRPLEFGEHHAVMLAARPMEKVGQEKLWQWKPFLRSLCWFAAGVFWSALMHWALRL